MEKDNKKDKKVNVIAMSAATKKRISKAAAEIKGKNLFIEKTELANTTLQNITLPI